MCPRRSRDAVDSPGSLVQRPFSLYYSHMILLPVAETYWTHNRIDYHTLCPAVPRSPFMPCSKFTLRSWLDTSHKRPHPLLAANASSLLNLNTPPDNPRKFSGRSLMDAQLRYAWRFNGGGLAIVTIKPRCLCRRWNQIWWRTEELNYHGCLWSSMRVGKSTRYWKRPCIWPVPIQGGVTHINSDLSLGLGSRSPPVLHTRFHNCLISILFGIKQLLLVS